MRVSRSTSLMAGRVKSRTSKVVGRMEGKYRWKKIRFRMPFFFSLLAFILFIQELRKKYPLIHLSHSWSLRKSPESTLEGFCGAPFG